MNRAQDFLGEFIGTFILVFFGCGSVAVTVLYQAHIGLFQVAMVWGFGVTVAIYATRHLSCAHLNPAVSLAMVLGGRMSARKLPTYWGAQFAGAFCAAAVVYYLFSGSIVQYEALHGIIRGTPASVKTAMMFGEYYPNPGAPLPVSVSTFDAFMAEGISTFLLVFLIFALTEGCNVGRPDDSLAPFFIGMSVMIIICVIAPLTQAGLNPARDLSPRLVAYLTGWGTAALAGAPWGFLIVYVLGPLAGAGVAALAFTGLIQPLMTKKNAMLNCKCNQDDKC